MPVMPPGNRLFRTYYDLTGKHHSVYIGPDLITCARCGRITYQATGGACPWGPLCRVAENAS